MNIKSLMFFLILFVSKQTFSQYNFYYGNIHSHTDFSDGNKDKLVSGVSTPAGSFAYAKGSYHTDFWGISEHNHFTQTNNPGMLLAKYAEGLYQADTSNQNGIFITMYGMEWGTISSGGHIVTYGSPNLIGWETIAGSPNYDIFCEKGDYISYWDIVKNIPNCFTTLAHPELSDYNDLLVSLPYSSAADSAIVGCAVRSGAAFSTTTDYSDSPAQSYESKFKRALSKGYHLGPTIDHDNHYTTFGRTSKSRTVVLAQALHRDSIYAAYQQMRFFASDDWNTEVNFDINGNVMGNSITTFSSTNITVSVADLDISDTTQSIRIYYGIPGSNLLPSVLTSNSYQDTLTFSLIAPNNSTYYYYAKIIQKDGDVIWTSPIWVNSAPFPLAITLTNFDAIVQGNQCVAIDFSFENDDDLQNIVLEHSSDAISFTPLYLFSAKDEIKNNSFLDTTPNFGINYYRLKMINIDSSISYSYIKQAVINTPKYTYSLSPNPTTDFLNFDISSFNSFKGNINIYNAEGRILYTEQFDIYEGNNKFQFDVSSLKAGFYYFVIQTTNKRIVDTKFFKQ